MRDIDRCRAQPPLQFADFDAHGDAQLGVEVGERFVEQKRLRLPNDGAAHGDALALAAGELARLAIKKRPDLQDLRGFVDARLDLGLIHPAIAQSIRHVVVNGHVRIERVVLKHHGDVALGRFDVVDDTTADIDLARGRRLEPRDHPKQGGLSAAGRTDQHAELPVADVEADALDGFDATCVDLAHIPEGDVCHRRPISPSRPDRARTAVA